MMMMIRCHQVMIPPSTRVDMGHQPMARRTRQPDAYPVGTQAVDTTELERFSPDQKNDDYASWDESDSSSEGSDLEDLLQDLPDANLLMQQLQDKHLLQPNESNNKFGSR